MIFSDRLRGLYGITDFHNGTPQLILAERMLGAGIGIIQFRNKILDMRDAYEVARQIAELCRRHGAIFIVNDRSDLAAAVGAHGVHLGQEDLEIGYARKVLGKDGVIGISTHSLSQALQAQEAGADYIGVGPIFPTGTKDAGTPLGVLRLAEIRDRINIPIVAIGGISPENVRSVVEAGADMVASISALFSGGRLENNVEAFRKAWNGPRTTTGRVSRKTE